MINVKIPIIIVFAASLMSMPFANVDVFGDGTASLDPECPVTTPVTIAMGSFSIGVDGTEVESTMATGGTVGGTLELSADDWIGAGTLATGSIHLVGVIAGDLVTINDLVYTAVAGAKADNTEFSINTSMTAAATDLADSITNDGRAGTTDDVTATSGANAVLLKSTVLGTTGNSINLAETVANAGTTISGATLSGAEVVGVVHMQAETTKYKITTDGSASTGDAYSAKTAAGVQGVNTVLTSTVDPLNSVNLSMQISGVGTLENLPYSGALTQVLTFTVTCN